jgi:hypothetical protein
MSTAKRFTQYCPTLSFDVATGQTVAAGRCVALASNTTVQHSNTDTAIGVAIAAATAGNPVEVYMFGDVVPMLVGTGGATQGVAQTLAADGVTDAATHDSSGTTDDEIVGWAMETGVATDIIGVMLCRGNRGSA